MSDITDYTFSVGFINSYGIMAVSLSKSTSVWGSSSDTLEQFKEEVVLALLFAPNQDRQSNK